MSCGKKAAAQIALLMAGVAMLCFGVWRGEAATVLSKLSIGGGIVNRRSGGVPSPKVLHCVYLSAAMAALQGMMLREFLHDVRFW